jgi:hypothetical protein
MQQAILPPPDLRRDHADGQLGGDRECPPEPEPEARAETRDDAFVRTRSLMLDDDESDGGRARDLGVGEEPPHPRDVILPAGA